MLSGCCYRCFGQASDGPTPVPSIPGLALPEPQTARNRTLVSDASDLHDQRRIGVSPLRDQSRAQGRTKAELDKVIGWLTGYDEATLLEHLAADTTFEAFFAEARLNPKATLITGVCAASASRTSTIR